MNNVHIILKAALLKHDHKSIWGLGIKELQRDPTDAHYYQLVADLKKQIIDDRGCMMDVLGEELLVLIEQVHLPVQGGASVDMCELGVGQRFIFKVVDTDVYEVVAAEFYVICYRLADNLDARVFRHRTDDTMPVFLIINTTTNGTQCPH